MADEQQEQKSEQDVPLENRFEFRFEASGAVGKGTADAVPGKGEQE